ncbi:hypothetical protein Lal_00007774 [Lupinus albus]|uniref:Putative aminoacyltransferase, E1 ubiquitin-activating enzyme n=1 Tax=Lupinus albus TaxID=3870 RepID=A0A6A4P5K8_LUPAL|nr:putative aminoacyltransferase, E1 ubiquitin-activating enzyme [Lupinus albus]KAF1875158.1 hypothetical protein Lal_00007774 [Lupinus albus]
MEGSTPFSFTYEVFSPPLDERDVAFQQSLAEVLNVDFFSIKIHVTYRIICLTREQLRQLPEEIDYYESSYDSNMLLSYREVLESDLFMDIPDTIVPPELNEIVMPEVMRHARNLYESPRSDSNGETSGSRLFNLVLDIDIDGLYDEVVNMVMEESAREVKMVPASKTEIDSLKKVNLGKDITMEECSICLVEFNGDKKVLAMPCKHMYHQECITQWLQRSGVCPLCRYSLSKNSS